MQATNARVVDFRVVVGTAGVYGNAAAVVQCDDVLEFGDDDDCGTTVGDMAPVQPVVGYDSAASRQAAWDVAFGTLVAVVGEGDVELGLWVVEQVVARTRLVVVRGTDYGDAATVVLTGRLLDTLAERLPGWEVRLVW